MKVDRAAAFWSGNESPMSSSVEAAGTPTKRALGKMSVRAYPRASIPGLMSVAILCTKTVPSGEATNMAAITIVADTPKSHARFTATPGPSIRTEYLTCDIPRHAGPQQRTPVPEGVGGFGETLAGDAGDGATFKCGVSLQA
jgi:hypothetical protein